MATVFACPTPDVLERLLLGQVTGDEASSLESHVIACAQCGQAFQGIRAEDGLVTAMQQAGSQPQVASAAAEALIPWLKRLRPKDSACTIAATTSDGETPPTTLAMPTYDFLDAPVEADEIGRLGNYRILQPIGVGGMGIVFLAEDARLKRHVALKLIKPELLQRRDLHERFLSEARAVAAVEHDNIVVIHEADEISGIPYLVMPFLQGESLEEYLRRQDGPLPVEEIMRIGREIASGLAAAHGRDLVHRDIKPSNLWLETCGSGRVKIFDFGLAGTMERLAEAGEPNAIVGTPAYMSPEQGRGLPADARSDLFSLGCVMYRMATGRLPFQGKDVMTTLLSLATETPIAPQALNPKLPAELAAVIEKLLAKKADERFASAAEVVAAIRKTERKRQPRAIGRWVALTAACVGLAVLGTFALVTGLQQPPAPVEITFEYHEPDSVLILQGEDGEKEIDIAKTAEYPLRPGEYVIRPKIASANRTLWPASFVVEPKKPMVIPFRLVGLIRSCAGHSQGVNAVAFLPKDSHLALSGSNDHDLRLWDTSKADAGIRLVGHQSPVRCLAISPDGKTALTGSGKAHPRDPDVHIRVWDLESRTTIAKLGGNTSSVTALAYDPQGQIFLSGDKDGMLIFWDAKKLTPIKTIHAPPHTGVYALAFLPGGKQALSAGADNHLHLWNVQQTKIAKSLDGHAEAITGVSAAPDGKHAATSSTDGTVRVWDLATGKCMVLRGHENEVHCVAYSPDGKRLLSGGWDKTVRLWNASTGEPIHALRGHHKAVRSVAFASDGRRGLSGAADGVVCLWELPK